MKTLDEIEKLLNASEDEYLEFKSSFNAEVIESLVAFANTHGGKVIIEVNPKGEVIGVKISDESVQNWINDVKGKTAPPIIPVGITI